MDTNQETFGAQLYRLRTARRLSGRDLAALAGVEPSLISRVENGKKAAGPVTIEKLANGLKVVGDERNTFIKAGSKQSTRTAQVFGPSMANPFFRSVFCDLLRTLGVRGEVLGFSSEAGEKHRYDLVVTMTDGTILGVEFKPGKILVATADAKGRLSLPTEAAVLATGGFVAELKINRRWDQRRVRRPV